MTENCKHKKWYSHGGEIICHDCNQSLIPNWTTKPEPIKLEFETQIPHTNFAITFLTAKTDSKLELIKAMNSGKRFKITAEEIV